MLSRPRLNALGPAALILVVLLGLLFIMSSRPFGDTQGASAQGVGELIGLFGIDAGVCTPASPPTSGSYFRMADGSGSFIVNSASPCSDLNDVNFGESSKWTPISPGGEGGMKTGQFQPHADPAFITDPGNPNIVTCTTNGINQPQQWFGITFCLATQSDVIVGNPPPGDEVTTAPPPTIIHDGAGNLSGDHSSLSITWSNGFYAQGNPRPDDDDDKGITFCSGPGDPKPECTGTGLFSLPHHCADDQPALTGTFDPDTNFYTLDWTSRIGGAFGCGFIGFWHFEGTFVPGEATEATVGGGGTVTTDSESDGASASDPIETEVTTPNGGTVTISEDLISQAAPTGFVFLGQQVDITAPAASPSDPLVIKFRIDSSLIPAGENKDTIQIFKDGSQVPACTGAAGTASPDPCVSNRALLGDGDVEITVLTSTPSAWNFGVVQVTPTPAPTPPPTPTPTVAPATATPEPTPTLIEVTTYGGSLVGLFEIAPGVCDANGIVSTGSFFAMTDAGGSPVSNTSPDAGCFAGNDPLKPGSEGGLKTGVYQPHPNPPLDNAGHSLAGHIIQPRLFFSVRYGIATTANVILGISAEEEVTSAPPPTITLASTAGPVGTLSGKVSAISISWSNNFFSQGNPRIDDADDKDAGGNSLHCADDQPPLKGTLNVETGFYTLDWFSRIGGSFGCGFVGQWHLEGTFKGTIPSTKTLVLGVPGTGAGGLAPASAGISAWILAGTGLSITGVLGLMGTAIGHTTLRRRR